MRGRTIVGAVGAILFAALLTSAVAAAPKPAAPKPKAKTPAAPAAPAAAAHGGELYVVGTSHLDTQWRWTIRETIDQYIPATMHDNFALFEKYPGYVFSFEGAFRYMLMKEYYPDDWARVKDYAGKGRWKVAGSWVDAVDTNIPSTESLVRQTLYGNGWWRRELGQTSRDVFLPDCFGFGWALPSVAAHCGLFGFSTQKLAWGSAYGTPFAIGAWKGVDGSSLIAAIKPGDYVSKITTDLSADTTVVNAIDRQGQASGLYDAFKYFGTGDIGGAPTDSSTMWLQRSLEAHGPVHVRSTASDQIMRDVMALPLEQRAKLPVWNNELVMTSHGVGCYTSQAAMKRWNRQNEVLADAAERASTAAAWLGAAPYPREDLREAWVRFLWNQFHDDLTGTSIPQAYTYAWNDEAIASNRFATILANAAGGVARALDTRAQGEPVVVYNPLSIPREDVVEAKVLFHGGAPIAARVYDPDGAEVPSQVVRSSGDTLRVTFLAAAPPTGFAVFDVREASAPSTLKTGLSVNTSGAPRLENRRYRVGVDANGDVSSIFDKSLNKELLAEPLRLLLLDDEPSKWPAWEINYSDLTKQPRGAVGGPPRVFVIEDGAARVALEITRQAEGSTFVQRISLAAGAAGDRLEIDNSIDWRTPGTLLVAAFPLAARAPQATYDLGLGTIQRGLDTANLYEVPAQRWADLTDAAGAFGVTVLNDCKYGWDRPSENLLRLALIHTPRISSPNWQWVGDQATQDIGHHRVKYAVVGHAGDWRTGPVSWEADRLNQPLVAFQAPQHKGELGARFSLVSVETPGASAAAGAAALPTVAIRALKYAEDSDEVIFRLQELTGRPAPDVRVSFARGFRSSVREVNGAEESIGNVPDAGGLYFKTELTPYQPRAFAVKLGPAPVRLDPPAAQPLELPWNLDGVSTDATRTDGDFDGAGHTIAGELLPAAFTREGIAFKTGPQENGRPNVVACRGQSLPLPAGNWDRLLLIAATVGGDRNVTFGVDGRPVGLRVQDWAEPIGQWDSRLVAGELVQNAAEIVPGYVKPAPVGWIGTHRHDGKGRNESYIFTHFGRYTLELPRGAKTLTLPNDPRVRILAATVASDPNAATAPVTRLIETPNQTAVMIHADRHVFVDTLTVALTSPNPGATIRYTLGGSDPATASPVYASALKLTANATLKARATVPGMDDRYVAAATFTKMAPRAGMAPAGGQPVAREPGLLSRLFEGQFQKLPDFSTIKPAKTAIVPQFGIPPDNPRNYFALDQIGWLNVPATGVYRFTLSSDDGSALWLDGEWLIVADGLHGSGEHRAEIALQAGWHAIDLRYFQSRGDVELTLLWEGPGIEKGPIAAEALTH